MSRHAVFATAPLMHGTLHRRFAGPSPALFIAWGDLSVLVGACMSRCACVLRTGVPVDVWLKTWAGQALMWAGARIIMRRAELSD